VQVLRTPVRSSGRIVVVSDRCGLPPANASIFCFRSRRLTSRRIPWMLSLTYITSTDYKADFLPVDRVLCAVQLISAPGN
jgi:hypothetical protein